MADKYVLLVEDSEDDIKLAERAFQKCRANARLIVTRNGCEALDFLFCRHGCARRNPQDRPALVLLDLKLPLIGGLEILETVRSEKSTAALPVVILTSSMEEKDRTECLKLKADRFFSKPVEFDDFLSIVRELKEEWLQ
jgi:two-component system response regulator